MKGGMEENGTKKDKTKRPVSLETSLEKPKGREKRKSKRSRSSSSSSSSGSSSSSSTSLSSPSSSSKDKYKSKKQRKQEEGQLRQVKKDKKRAKEEKKAKKLQKKLKRLNKKMKKKQKKEKKKAEENVGSRRNSVRSDSTVAASGDVRVDDPTGSSPDLEASRARAPMTKEEWEKQQSHVRIVLDPETGRHRLIKGTGEVLEECLSRERHLAINKAATRSDGQFFQATMMAKLKKQ